MTRVLLTGAAGMIGYHSTLRLFASGYEVFGCDSFTSYYDIKLKEDRAREITAKTGLTVQRVDICDSERFAQYYLSVKPDIVINLAAQPGVRQGLEHPHYYVSSNLVGFTNILDLCRRAPPKHLLYASSSSVYGGNAKKPWAEDDPTEIPVSFYAATKKANELMAHSYSHITKIPMTGLRFFTVFGEWGRPDMAPYKFASAVRNDQEITVFNRGEMSRDFTYVGDAVEAMIRMIDVIPSADKPGMDGVSPVAPHRTINIGSGRPIAIPTFIGIVETTLNKTARIKYAERAAGDVVDTYASTDRLQKLTGYVPSTPFEDGIRRLCEWLERYER